MPVQILVAEDSPTQAEALAALLDAHGYRPTVARSGEEALELARKQRFDVLLTDVVMPGIDGYELCRRIKAGVSPDLPVLLLTSLTDPLDIVRGLECGADNYLTKPYDPELLLRRLDYILVNRALRRETRATVGVTVKIHGTALTITSDKEQILDALVASIEEVLRAHKALEESQKELAAAHAQLEQVARQIAREARVSTEKYRRLMEQAADAIFILDVETRILEANAGAAALLGWSVEQLQNRTVEEFLDPQERPAFEQQMTRLRAAHKLAPWELRFRNRDGGLVICDFAATLLPEEPTALGLAIARDITDRKRAEELQEQLRQAQKMEAVGQLAGGIAHDFNNLLTGITGYCEFLLGDLPADDARHQDVLEIKAAADRAAALTRQLLAFSRKQILHPAVLDLNAIVLDMQNLLRRVIGEDIELRSQLAPDLGRVRADRGQIEQVIMNLVVNARDAMPRGGKLSIETANRYLDESYASTHGGVEPGHYVMIAVSDTGVGITPEVQARIFEPFFTTKERGKGTGLGLATVYGIVQQSGGSIWVYSEVGSGTALKVYLPRVADDLAAEQPRPLAPANLEGTETILLLEDDDVVRDIARRALERHGYTVLESSDPEEALRVLNAHAAPIDLLLTDVIMPRGSGREFARVFQQKRPDAKILYMSGYTPDEISQRGVIEAGVAFLEKPFTPDTLLLTIREVLAAPENAPGRDS